MNPANARSGLVLGKFLPPHLGHLHLVRRAASMVDELTVLVCSLAREPIPGELRAEWMRELCAEISPAIRVVHLADENPSEPHEDPRFWEIWTESIRRAMPAGPSVVFTSETYGDELARRLGAEHVVVDLQRNAFPVSGSMIRARPFDYWPFIPKPVRPWFVKRVAIVGSESTGKTTLARDLAARFHTTWVPEFARAYVDDVHGGLLASLGAVDIEPIARGQIAAEDAAAREANRVLILDTTLVSTAVYARHYYDQLPDWIDRAATARRVDLYLLTDIDVPWVPDPQRDRPDQREHMHALFRDALESRGLPYELLRGPWHKRLATAIALVRRLLGSPK